MIEIWGKSSQFGKKLACCECRLQFDSLCSNSKKSSNSKTWHVHFNFMLLKMKEIQPQVKNWRSTVDLVSCYHEVGSHALIHLVSFWVELFNYYSCEISRKLVINPILSQRINTCHFLGGFKRIFVIFRCVVAFCLWTTS